MSDERRWVCENHDCRAEYAEYVNGCPKCFDGRKAQGLAPLQFSVREQTYDGEWPKGAGWLVYAARKIVAALMTVSPELEKALTALTSDQRLGVIQAIGGVIQDEAQKRTGDQLL